MLVDGKFVRSCAIRTGSTRGEVTTIEGVGNVNALHAVQASWIRHQVAQCGYCQSGMIMAAIALLDRNPSPSDEDIDIALSGNLCRCGTYSRIRTAIKSAASALQTADAAPRRSP